MADVDYQDILEDGDADLDPVVEDLPRTRSAPGRDRDCRRAIEELREERRLRQLLSDFDDDEDEDLDD